MKDIVLQLSPKEYKLLAKLAYFGHEIVADSGEDDRKYHRVLDKVFEKALEGGLPAFSSLESMEEQDLIADTLFDFRLGAAWKFLAITLAKKDCENEYGESDDDPYDMPYEQQKYMIERANYYMDLLEKKGFDCIKIVDIATADKET